MFDRWCPADQSEIDGAVADFRNCWRNIRLFECHFLGDIADVHALDYIHYECPYPESGVPGAAIVFGEVLRRHAPLFWFKDALGHLVLRTAEHPHFAIWPLGRVCEMHARSHPQFEKYGWLMQLVLCELIAHGVCTESTLLPLYDREENQFWGAWLDAVQRLARRE